MEYIHLYFWVFKVYPLVSLFTIEIRAVVLESSLGLRVQTPVHFT